MARQEERRQAGWQQGYCAFFVQWVSLFRCLQFLEASSATLREITRRMRARAWLQIELGRGRR